MSADKGTPAGMSPEARVFPGRERAICTSLAPGFISAKCTRDEGHKGDHRGDGKIWPREPSEPAALGAAGVDREAIARDLSAVAFSDVGSGATARVARFVTVLDRHLGSPAPVAAGEPASDELTARVETMARILDRTETKPDGWYSARHTLPSLAMGSFAALEWAADLRALVARTAPVDLAAQLAAARAEGERLRGELTAQQTTHAEYRAHAEREVNDLRAERENANARADEAEARGEARVIRRLELAAQLADRRLDVAFEAYEKAETHLGYEQAHHATAEWALAAAKGELP